MGTKFREVVEFVATAGASLLRRRPESQSGRRPMGLTVDGDRMVHFAVTVHHEGGQLWAEVAELPGCFATGDDMDELGDSLAEALQMCLPASHVIWNQARHSEEMGPREDCTPEVREWWVGVKRAAQDPAFWERDPITFDLRSAHEPSAWDAAFSAVKKAQDEGSPVDPTAPEFRGLEKA